MSGIGRPHHPLGGTPPVPADVWAWVQDTYLSDGVSIWLRAWQSGDDHVRDRMAAAARTPSGGT